MREGTVLFDPVSGALTAADKVSARRIRVKEVPLASHPEKLRKLLFEIVADHGGVSRQPRAGHGAHPDRRPDLP